MAGGSVLCLVRVVEDGGFEAPRASTQPACKCVGQLFAGLRLELRLRIGLFLGWLA